MFLIIKIEYSSKSVFSSYLSGVCANYIYELFECQFFICLSHGGNNMYNIRISTIQSKLFQNFTNFNWINLSTSIFIKNQESLSEQFIHFWCNTFSPLSWDFFSSFRSRSWFINWDWSHNFSKIFTLVHHFSSLMLNQYTVYKISFKIKKLKYWVNLLILWNFKNIKMIFFFIFQSKSSEKILKNSKIMVRIKF